jgi:phosphatidylserine/phosphatidylglycerophosphate/cardiolipin synthase-like enzyme
MRLIVQPRDGVEPLLSAVKNAKKSIDIVIFRFDLDELEKALKAAIERGVAVHALVAHMTGSGDKKLRNLESRLLKWGATVARTDDDMVRYHGKLLLVDKATLFVLGFNYTDQDIHRSRSLGIIVKKPSVVREADRLIKVDEDRSQSFRPSRSDLVISPENARDRLLRFIRKARRELLIYDANVTDDEMLQALRKRANAGVTIRVLGHVEKKWRGKGLKVRKLYRRLHVRAMVRDGQRAFVGSQSLRRLELDERREVGIVIREKKIVRKIERIFKGDWQKSAG